jgi:hypothetical protein
MGSGSLDAQLAVGGLGTAVIGLEGGETISMFGNLAFEVG